MNFLKNLMLWLLFPGAVSAQYITVDGTYATQQLVQNVLINNPCASASNVIVSGMNFGSSNSFGYFTAGSSSFPFADGIILSTGSATSAVGPNTDILSEGPTNWPGDQDLEQALNIGNTINATIMEFDFIPIANKISFDYIFSSEQYLANPSANQCNYTDGFAFLLKPANSAQPYQNLAVVPGTNTPVKVNTVRGPGTICPEANAQYFDAFNEEEHPTNFNGQTVVMTAQAEVIPNITYHIKLVVADQGNNLYDSAIFLAGGSFRVEKDLGPNRLVATGNPACDGETISLDATMTGATAYQWSLNGLSIPGSVSPQLTLSSPGLYSVQIDLGSGCFATGEIKIEYSAAVVASPATLYQCDADNDNTAIFDLTDAEDLLAGGVPGNVFTYFTNLADAQSDINQITSPTIYSATAPSTVVVKLTNQYGCIAFSTINLEISNNAIVPLQPVGICDEDTNADGIAWINFSQLVTPSVVAGLPAGLTVLYYLTESDAYANQNPLPNIWTNTVAEQQVVYARILNGPDCYGVMPVTLNISRFPDDFVDEVVYICPGGTLTLSVPNIFATYSWSTGDADFDAVVNAPGIYPVTVTNGNGCSRSKIFDVRLTETPVITSVVINDFSGNNNEILINYTGNGNYEFSIDGTEFQSEPSFTNVAPGEYAIYINDLTGCGNAGPFQVYVLDYPRYFTPNGDGINDTWNLKGPPSVLGSKLRIFDRYGKLLYDFTPNSDGWDGKLFGADLPSTDYWFVLQLPDGRILKSHFSLKR